MTARPEPRQEQFADSAVTSHELTVVEEQSPGMVWVVLRYKLASVVPGGLCCPCSVQAPDTSSDDKRLLSDTKSP